MSISNTKNRIVALLTIFGLLVSFTSMHAQNDTIKKKSKPTTFKSLFDDSQKKADGISIIAPDNINPIFNLSKKKTLALKDISYYLNLNSESNTQKKDLSFMSTNRNKVDSDVLVQRNFNGQDTSNPSLKSDGSLGTIESSTKSVRIEFRDYGLVDGDRVRIFLNEQVVDANVTLKGLSAFLDLNLKKGYNRIDFQALNQGLVGPNTAEFAVYDDKGKIIKVQAWNLNSGKTATLGIIRY